MNLYEKLTKEQQSIIENFEFTSTSGLAKQCLKNESFGTQLKLIEALTVWDIFEPNKPFSFLPFMDLFAQKEIIKTEILKGISKEKTYNGFSEESFIEIQTKKYMIDLSYKIIVNEDETVAELKDISVYNIDGDEINIDHISNESIEKVILE